jgi:hypothetical protein
MLGADVGVAHPLGFFLSQTQDAPRALSKSLQFV